MAGLGIAIYTDEHVHADLAPALRRLGYDVVSCQEEGQANQSIDDEDQLIYAAQLGRAILSNNFTDFEDLDRQWKASNRHHAGIIVYSRSPTFTALLQKVRQHLDTIDPQVQNDILLWLP